jgi:hypothetical protein
MHFCICLWYIWSYLLFVYHNTMTSWTFRCWIIISFSRFHGFCFYKIHKNSIFSFRKFPSLKNKFEKSQHFLKQYNLVLKLPRYFMVVQLPRFQVWHNLCLRVGAVFLWSSKEFNVTHNVVFAIVQQFTSHHNTRSWDSVPTQSTYSL